MLSWQRLASVTLVLGILTFLTESAAAQPPTAEPAPAIAGSTDKLSYVPGDVIRFHFSTQAKSIDLEIARVGAERQILQISANLPGRAHPIPPDASANGCRWPVAFSLKTPTSWKSGYYTGRMKVTLPDGKN